MTLHFRWEHGVYYLVDSSLGHLEVLSSEYELFHVYVAAETQINGVTSVSPRVGVGEKSGWPLAAASPPRSQSCVLSGKLTIRPLVSLIEMDAVSLLNRGGIADKAEPVSLHGRMFATKETRRDVGLATVNHQDKGGAYHPRVFASPGRDCRHLREHDLCTLFGLT